MQPSQAYLTISQLLDELSDIELKSVQELCQMKILERVEQPNA